MPYDCPSEPSLTTFAPSDVLTPGNNSSAWSPCYICFDSCGDLSYSTLVIVQLLMHEIWTWENEMADEIPAEAELEAGLRSQPSQSSARIPHESELLPCHYFDFFYGASRGGIIATLLGRLRLRVEDAKHHYQSITRAMFSHRHLFSSQSSSLGILKRPKFRSTGLVNAVHDTIMKHSVRTSECGGTDELFRTQSALLTPAEGHRLAQTCIKVKLGITPYYNMYGYSSKARKSTFESCNVLRTFRSGCTRDRRTEDIRNVPFTGPSEDICHVAFTDQLNLTICQVISAATATPGLFHPFETSTGTKPTRISDVGLNESSPTSDAMRDYEDLYQDHEALDRDASFERESSLGTNDRPAMFLNIGCFYRQDPSPSFPRKKYRVRIRQIRADQ
jgi:hypothetical protein